MRHILCADKVFLYDVELVGSVEECVRFKIMMMRDDKDWRYIMTIMIKNYHNGCEDHERQLNSHS